jgi:hypothetical protein
MENSQSTEEPAKTTLNQLLHTFWTKANSVLLIIELINKKGSGREKW